MRKSSGNRLLPFLLTAGISLVLASCAAVGPDYVQPEAPVPDTWGPARNAGLQATRYELIEWWEVFNDPELNRLVEIAHEQNYNLKLAGLRVLEARAQLGIAVGAQYPQQQFISGDVTRIGPSENAGQGDTSFNQYDLSASLAWEMDFWGKFRRGIESADAALQASVANYDEAMILITAQVVSTYVTIRTLEEQLRIARENLKLQQRSYDIATVLYKNGQDSELDVQQALSLLLNTEATVPSLEAQVNLSRNAMDTLLGQNNGYTETLISEGPIPEVPQQIAVGIPADLMRRRPDLREAELQVVAQNAQVGVATADLYPSIALNGSLGVFSISSDVGGGGGSSLFESDSVGYTAGASFSWPVLNYGRIRNNVRVQDARLQQAIVSYQQQALEAAQEVDDAMESLTGAQAQKEILINAVKSAKRSNELSTLRYKEGFSDYQRVLDSQQSLITSQNRYVTAQGQAVQSVVAIYKALGGGWEVREGKPFVDENTLTVMRERTHWGALLDDQ
ncbi:MAG: efflux transporter outer membrane subunit [Xanthomonadales bacterium]|jgi:NodT family efflux transporter outer membrane factor (OMF) lipoprotein|nr:efflux transporter outer membrane subunit [Xanthomonadales bacterium]MDH4002470.1 efflux transporter outer membrane subunit [Xanthomonadales bacterium]